MKERRKRLESAISSFYLQLFSICKRFICVGNGAFHYETYNNDILDEIEYDKI